MIVGAVTFVVVKAVVPADPVRLTVVEDAPVTGSARLATCAPAAIGA